MSETTTEKSGETKGEQYFQGILNNILDKLRDDPSSITTEDARRLSENAVAGDMRTAKIISAVEAFAAASKVIHDVDPQLGQPPHTSLLTVVSDLKAAVDQNPTDVTTEVLRTAQNVVSKMQKAVGHTNAPHPELEAELREEIAKIQPKVIEGTVTIEQANHLHSLEARAHGHTEKGGITSIAQSVAAKRERQLSLSSGTSPTGNRSRANSKTFAIQEQSQHEQVTSLKLAEMSLVSKLNNESEAVSEQDAAHIQSREHRAHGHINKGDSASKVMASAHKRENSQPSVEVN